MALFTAIAGAVGTLFTKATFTTFLIRTGARLATSAVLKLLAGDRDGNAFGTHAKLNVGAETPRGAPLGVGYTEGTPVYASYWGAVGKTKNAYVTQVIALSDLPIKGVISVLVNGAYCTPYVGSGTQPARFDKAIQVGADASDTLADGLLAANSVVAEEDLGTPLLEFRQDGKNHAWVKIYDGTQTVADSLLTGRGAHPDHPWSEQAIGDGVAYAVVTTLANPELFSGGVPKFGFVLDSVRLYDPSKDSSVGGVGKQRWQNPATWGGSGDYLPVVQAYNILRGITFKGKWVYGFQGTQAGQLPPADWIAEINECRATVQTPEGPRPKFRSGGVLDFSIEAGAAIEEIMATCGGRIAEMGGIYRPRVGAGNRPIVAHIDSGDVSSLESKRLTTLKRLADSINGIVISYPSPEDGFVMKPLSPLYRADLEARDGGRRLPAALQMTNMPYVYQGEHLQRVAMREAERWRQCAFVLPPKFANIRLLDDVTLTYPRLGYENKRFRVDAKDVRDDCSIFVLLTEMNPDDYDPPAVEDFKGKTVSWVVEPSLLPEDVPGFMVFPDFQPDAEGRPRRPAIRYTWTPSAIVDARGIQVRARLLGGSKILSTKRSNDLTSGEDLLGNVLPNTQYQVQARIIADRPTVWTDWESVTTPDVRLTADDLDSGITGAIDAAQDRADEAFARHDADLASATGVVAELRAAVSDRLGDLFGPVPSLPVLERLPEVEARSVRAEFDLDRVYQALTQAQINTAAVGQRVSDAGIYLDPATGQVRIAAFDALDGRTNDLSITLDAVTAELSLKASTTYVNQAISEAILDPSQIPVIDDLDLRITTAEVTLSGVEAQIALKADAVTVTGLSAQIGAAELDIDALQSAITLKADAADLTEVETRLGTAEVNLNALDVPSMTSTVAATRRLYDDTERAAQLSVIDLIQGYTDRQAIREASASATQQIRADVTEGFAAEAQARLDLAASVDSSFAGVVDQQRAFADALGAQADDILQLDAEFGEVTADITDESYVRADGSAGVAGRIASLATDFDGVVADITDQFYVRSDGTAGVAGRLTSFTAQFGEVNSELKDQNYVRADGTEGVAGRIASLSSDFGAVVADITDESYVRADGTKGTAGRIEDVSALAGDLSSSVTTMQTAVATLEGYAEATYSLRLVSGGATAGFEVVASDGPTGPASSARIFGGNIQLTGNTEVTGDFLAKSIFSETAWIKRAAIEDAAITRLKIAGRQIVPDWWASNQAGATIGTTRVLLSEITGIPADEGAVGVNVQWSGRVLGSRSTQGYVRVVFEVEAQAILSSALIVAPSIEHDICVLSGGANVINAISFNRRLAVPVIYDDDTVRIRVFARTETSPSNVIISRRELIAAVHMR